jgi:tetratricopeptide (TPR) repeat protein
MDPNSVPVFLNLGGFYYRRGMFEAAIPFYEKVIRANPKHYQGHYWLAMCYWKLQRYYAAINTLEEVIEFLPTFKDALNLMGECYEQIGEGAKAEHYYLKAISADPDGIIIHGGVLGGAAHDKRSEERIKH